MGRLLGIDYGEKRVGLAISDENQFIAFPLKVITYHAQKKLLEEIEHIFREQNIEKIVVGWPLNMNGSRGNAAIAAQDWAEKLRALLSCPVEMWDERLTSCSAEQIMAEAGVNTIKRRKVVDKIAAQLILQTYLDAHGHGKP